MAQERAPMIGAEPSPASLAEVQGTRALDLYRRAARTRERSLALMGDFARLRYVFEQASTPVTPEQLLEKSAYARLLARQQTMPVIEQAKGIIMAQSHCRESVAFDMLRKASQRSNVPVRELADQIVARAAARPRSSRGRRRDLITSTARAPKP